MDTYILWLQAQTLRWVGLGFLAIGLWLGTDPLTVAWRAALAAVAAMLLVGWGLRLIARVMQERIAADLAERTEAAERAAAPPPAPPRPAARR